MVTIIEFICIALITHVTKCFTTNTKIKYSVTLIFYSYVTITFLSLSSLFLLQVMLIAFEILTQFVLKFTQRTYFQHLAVRLCSFLVIASLWQQVSNVRLDKSKCYICTLTAGIGVMHVCFNMAWSSENNNNDN